MPCKATNCSAMKLHWLRNFDSDHFRHQRDLCHLVLRYPMGRSLNFIATDNGACVRAEPRVSAKSESCTAVTSRCHSWSRLAITTQGVDSMSNPPVKGKGYWSGTLPPYEPSQPCTSACTEVPTDNYLPHITPSRIACSESAEHHVTGQISLIRSPVNPFNPNGASGRSSGQVFCDSTCSLTHSCFEHIELISV